MIKDKKNINCNVESCEFNNSKEKNCNLNEIKVSTTTNPCDTCKKETICDSFKEKNKNS